MSTKLLICIIILSLALFFIIINKKIRCKKLLIDLFRIFYNNRKNKISFFDLFSFFICPILIGISIVVGFDYFFSLDVSNSLLTIFSILFTLLFGVLSLLTSTLNSKDTIKKKISNEAFTAVAFSMITSLLSLIIMIVYIILLEKISSQILFQTLSAIIIALAINMIMLFFMVIKRSYITSTTK